MWPTDQQRGWSTTSSFSIQVPRLQELEADRGHVLAADAFPNLTGLLLRSTMLLLGQQVHAGSTKTCQGVPPG